MVCESILTVICVRLQQIRDTPHVSPPVLGGHCPVMSPPLARLVWQLWVMKRASFCTKSLLAFHIFRISPPVVLQIIRTLQSKGFFPTDFLFVHNLLIFWKAPLASLVRPSSHANAVPDENYTYLCHWVRGNELVFGVNVGLSRLFFLQKSELHVAIQNLLFSANWR